MVSKDGFILGFYAFVSMCDRTTAMFVDYCWKNLFWRETEASEVGNWVIGVSTGHMITSCQPRQLSAHLPMHNPWPLIGPWPHPWPLIG